MSPWRPIVECEKIDALSPAWANEVVAKVSVCTSAENKVIDEHRYQALSRMAQVSVTQRPAHSKLQQGYKWLHSLSFESIPAFGSLVC